MPLTPFPIPEANPLAILFMACLIVLRPLDRPFAISPGKSDAHPPTFLKTSEAVVFIEFKCPPTPSFKLENAETALLLAVSAPDLTASAALFIFEPAVERISSNLVEVEFFKSDHLLETQSFA